MSGKDTCKSTAELDDMIKDSRLSMAIVNTVVDLKDYKKPIQYILDDGLFWELIPNIRKKANIFIRKSKASFEDSYFFQFGFPREEEFYQVAEHK